jgi:outer membrane receptor for ferrienterochelin and colicin
VTPYPPAFFARFRPNTALDMVQRLPGFTFDGGTSERGFSGTAGNVLLDGERPPSRSDSLSSVLSRIPASSVERVDIIRGGAPGIDMQGRAIMANVIRRKNGGVTGSVNAQVTSDKKGNAIPYGSASIQSQQNGQRLEGAMSYSSWDDVAPQTRLRTDPAGNLLLLGYADTENKGHQIEVTGSWEAPLFGGKLRANAKANEQRPNYVSEEKLVIPGGQVAQEFHDVIDTGEVGLRYSRDVGGYGVELVGFQSLTRDDSSNLYNTPDYTSGGAGRRDSGESIARATVKAPAYASVSVEAGGEAVYNYQDSDNTRLLNGAVFALDGDRNHVDELRTEGFASATWAPSKQLSVEAGARLEWSRIKAQVSAQESETSLQFLKPRVNVSWSPAKGHQFGFRIERKVDQLNFNFFQSTATFENQTFGVGNASIEPGRRWDYEARYEWSPGGQNSFVARLLHSDLDHYIGLTVLTLPPDSASPGLRVQIPRNVQEASGERLDLSAAFELDKLGLKGGLFRVTTMLQNSRTHDPVTGYERSLGGEQNWVWDANLSQSIDNGAIRWSIFASNYSSTHSYAPQSISFTEHGSNKGGADISWQPAKGWTLSASINRIYNLTNRNTFLFYDAPRDTGKLQYTERTFWPSYSSMTIGIRKNF